MYSYIYLFFVVKLEVIEERRAGELPAQHRQHVAAEGLLRQDVVVLRHAEAVEVAWTAWPARGD